MPTPEPPWSRRPIAGGTQPLRSCRTPSAAEPAADAATPDEHRALRMSREDEDEGDRGHQGAA